MTHWNHRVVRRIYNPGQESEEVLYGIHEAYYGLEGETKPAITNDPTEPLGETVEGLREELNRMLRALDKPVLDYETREEL
jgi:hypothetical protein